jgi:uncharacterized protein
MKISMYTMTVDSFVPALESLDKLLDKGAAHAREKNLDLVNARLAPDMYNLAEQVRLCCYFPRVCAARLTGREAPPMDESGKTFAEFKAAIAQAVDYVRSIPAAAFEGAEERNCDVAVPNADIVFALDGLQFLRSWTLPHFYFHLVTAYGILRHNGVAIGKQDYASWAAGYIRPKSR